MKEPLLFHLLTAVALLLAFSRLGGGAWRLEAIPNWLRGYSTEIFMLGWLALYPTFESPAQAPMIFQ